MPLSNILVIGGYGGFGARLSRRLARQGHHVLVAGRSFEKATAFCRDTPGAEPVRADRNGDMAAVLAEHRPDLLIDAAGPFQGSGYHVPRACIEARIAYIDLADAREFVSGIRALDQAALDAGIAVIGGASSVPSLSGAVARHLAAGMDMVRTVDIAISASTRATAGASVVAAILSYVGKPVMLWRGRRWTESWGWQELRRQSFFVDGTIPERGRWLGIADVPDHDLLPAMLPGRPAVTFHAGTEIGLQTIGLWLLSWPVRWLRLGSLVGLGPLLLWLQRLMRIFGSDRSAMSVKLKGLIGDKAVERQWTLIAGDGDGPEIPTLAAALLAEAVLSDRVASGARDASRLLTLDQFEPLFASLSIRHQTIEADLPPPLYERVMGLRFVALPQAVRQIHRVCGDGGASGQAEVIGGSNFLARLIARMLRFPPPGEYPLHIAFREQDGVEIWTRIFAGHRFTSRLSQREGLLVERFGPLRFHFSLPSDDQGLEMQMERWTCAGVPLPISLAPRSRAREWQDGDVFRFDVPIALPILGLIVHYQGWLAPNP